MDESMRIRILGDASNAQTAFQQVEQAAQVAADKVTGSFAHLGGLFKRTIGFAGIAVGIDTALTSASKLINAQKAQSQLIENQSKQQGSLIKLQDFQLEGGAKEYQWKSKTLDAMATQLSLSNAISKQDIVMAQNRQLTNTDLLKFYATGNGLLAKQNQTYKDIVNQAKLQGDAMSGSQAAMATTLTTAANLAEVTGRGINGSMMMLTRLMADPAKRMSSMSRMGIQIAKSDQTRIIALEKQKGLVAAQGELLNVLDKTYHNIAATATSPVEVLKNALANIWTALGEGLMPVLESLSSVVIDVVTPLIPVLQSMGKLIEEVAKALGTSLGSLISDLVPFIDLIVKGLLPAFLDLITPLVQMADKAITPLATAFGKLVGAGTDIGPLSQMFLTMGDTISKNLKPAVDFISQQFDKMSKNGDLNKMMSSVLDTFKALAPVLPQLAVSFAQLVIAITPAFIAALPDMVKAFGLFVQILVKLTPLLTTVIGWLTKLVSLITSNKGLTGAIGVLAALWFSKNLFLTPIMAAASGVGMLMGKLVSLGSATKTTGGLFKSFFTGGNGNRIGGVVEYRASRLENQAARTGTKLANAQNTKWFGIGSSTSRIKRLEGELESQTTAAKLLRTRQATVGTLGGGLKGLAKSLFGVGLGTAFNPTNQLDATNQNTQALVQLTEAMHKGGPFGGGLSGGYGGGLSGAGTPENGTLSGYEALGKNLQNDQRFQLADFSRRYNEQMASRQKGGPLSRAGSFLKDDFSAWKGQVGGMASGIGSKFSSLAGGLSGKFGSLVSGVGGKFGSLAVSIGGVFGSLVSGVGGKFGSLASGLAGKFGSMAGNLAGKFGNMASGLAGKLGGIVSRSGGLFGGGGSGFSGQGGDLGKVGKFGKLGRFFGLGREAGEVGKFASFAGKFGKLGKFGAMAGRLGGGAFSTLLGGGGIGDVVLNGLTSGMGSAGGGAMSKVGEYAGKAKNFAGKIVEGLKGKAGSVLMKVGKKLAGGVFEKVGVAVAEQGAKWAAAEGVAAALGPETLGASELVVNGALLAKTIWDKRKTLAKWGKTGVKFAGKAIGAAGKFAGKIGGGLVRGAGSVLKSVGGFFGGLFGGGGNKPTGGSAASGMGGGLMAKFAGKEGGFFHHIFGDIGSVVGKFGTSIGAAMTAIGALIFGGLNGGFMQAAGKAGTTGNLLATLLGGSMGPTIQKHHSGGIVQGPRGKEVPAILQAGEAVISLAQMNANRGGGGGNSLAVHPGAVSIVVNGNADAATTAQIKAHVEAQFKELHRTLKSMGR